MIRAQDLRKVYGDLVAVDGISLEIQRGEAFGLLGPNGAGKTTTIHMLVGALSPDAGQIEMDGAADATRPDIRRRIGVAPQTLSLYEELTGAENLAFFGRMYRVRGGRLKERVAWGLAFAGLTERASDRVKTYSGGMKRRLNLACALVHDPAVLFLDEPTVGVDPQSRNYIFENIETLKQQGCTVVYTTHYMEEAQRLCDRIAIIDHGKIIAVGTIPELLGMVTAADTVHFDFNDPVELDTDHLRIAVNGIETVTVSDRRLTVAAKGSEALMPDLIGAVKAAGLEPQSMTIEKPNLESVFLALTGRQLREG